MQFWAGGLSIGKSWLYISLPPCCINAANELKHDFAVGGLAVTIIHTKHKCNASAK